VEESSDVVWMGNPFGSLFYSAFVPGTVMADVLTNVILSMETVFAALRAWPLWEEVTSLQETLRGGLILVAALIATR
jgi:hypothetical protein